MGHGNEESLENPKMIKTFSNTNIIKIFAFGDQSGCMSYSNKIYFWGNSGYEPPQLVPKMHPKSLPKDEISRIKGNNFRSRKKNCFNHPIFRC